MNLSPHAKAIAAFLSALVAMLAAFGLDTGSWATPSLIETVASIGGALFAAITTWFVPNKPAA